MSKGKKINGEGTVAQAADGRWVGRASLGYEGGKRKRKAVYAKTKSEAIRKLRAVLAARDRGQVVPTGKQTLEMFLDKWLQDVRSTKRPNTYQGYESIVRIHISPVLGKIQLNKLTPQQIQTFLTRKLNEGKSPNSVRSYRTLLRLALGQAEKWELVSRNAAALTNSQHVPKKAFKTFTVGETRTFLEAVEDEPLGALFALAVTGGLRRGELLGLSWDDVNLEKKSKKGSAAPEVVVRQSLQRINGSLRIVETKSGKLRVVKLQKPAADALGRHRAQQLERKLASGREWRNEKNLVFPNGKGAPLETTTLNDAFKRILSKAGLPDIRVHDLRHTAATRMMEGGMHMNIAKEQLGHSSIAITMDLYSHVTESLQEDAVAELDRVFWAHS